MLDYGLHGWAERYAGVWVGMKCITDIVEVSASVDVDVERVKILLPEDFQLPPDGLNIRIPDTPLQQEARLLDYKPRACARQPAQPRALARARQPGALRHHDVGQGLSGHLSGAGGPGPVARGLPAHRPAAVQVGMVWPLESTGTQRFADGLDEILVVEEKRQVLEYQLKEELFGWIGSGKKIPRVVGKFDDKDGGEWAVPQGNWLLPAHYEFSPAMVAKAIASRLLRFALPRTCAPASRRGWTPSPRANRRWRARAWSRSASPGSVQAVRTIRPPACPRARAAWPASAATTW